MGLGLTRFSRFFRNSDDRENPDIDLMWDGAENAVKRYQYALKVVESGEKVPIGNRTDRSSSKARKNRLHGPIRVKRSGSVKGVKDGQERQALLA